jgi:arginine exporter protein ArgO
LKTYLNPHLYLSGVGLGVDLRKDTKMTSFLRDIGVSAQNWLIILCSILETISETFTILQGEIE